MTIIKTTQESRPTHFQSSNKRNQLRNSPRNRTSVFTRKVTRLITDATTPLSTTVLTTTSTTLRPRTTRIVRKRVSTARRVLTTTESAPILSVAPLKKSTTVKSIKTTTSEPPIEISSLSSNYGLDDEIASVLPALTSVKPRKTLIFNDSLVKDFHHKDAVVYNHIESTSVKDDSENSFDKILEHQYKIKGLDKDYEDENLEEDEKLIGVLGSQVNFLSNLWSCYLVGFCKPKSRLKFC